MVDTVAVVTPTAPARSYVEWAPIIAGAVAAAAISLLLFGFGASIGLTAISPWPESGLPWWLLMLLAALWVLLVQIGSYTAGGYLAGRLRAPLSDAAQHEVQFRDGAHGFLVWALGVVVTAAVIGSTAGGFLRTGVEAASSVAAGAMATSGAAAEGPLDAVDPMGYAIDRLLRPGAVGAEPLPDGELRSEASRIFATGLGDTGLASADRAYLADVVAARTGLSPEAAEGRIDEAFAVVRDAETRVRDAADQARRSAAIGGFLATAAVLISAAAAALAAGMGGTHRDSSHSARFFGTNRFW
jgi:hypothetical protein